MHLNEAQLIYQGAEARVYRVPFLDREAIAKERFAKTYRHPELDRKLTIRRVVQEARLLQRCQRAGIDAPAVYHVDMSQCIVYMENIVGITVRDYLRQLASTAEQSSAGKCNALACHIGTLLAKMHDADVIHSDLTTSNLMLRKQTEDRPLSVVVIDFGLSYISNLPEDKAVDLYVLERAFISTHPNSETMASDATGTTSSGVPFQAILDAYAKAGSKAATKAVLHKLADVRLRGRKRSMVG